MRNAPQPSPAPGGQSVTDALHAFIDERRAKGVESYGVELQTNNGRDPIADLMDELIDGAKYAMQWRMERKQMLAVVDAARRLMAAHVAFKSAERRTESVDDEDSDDAYDDMDVADNEYVNALDALSVSLAAIDAGERGMSEADASVLVEAFGKERA